MSRRWMLVALAAALPAAACGGAGEDGPARDAASAGAEREAAQAVEDVVYVDVRTPAEHAQGHVQGAILIPHDQMESRWRELEPYKDRTLVVYCRSGRRSGLAIDVLESKGFTKLVNGGGLEDLAARGVPTEG